MGKLNKQSPPRKFEQLKLFVTISFILLCETFLTDPNAYLYRLPVYLTLYTNVYKNGQRTRWGVAIYQVQFYVPAYRDDLALFSGECESYLVKTPPGIAGEIPNTAKNPQ